MYSFSAKPGDVIRVSGEGCDLGNLVLSLVEANGREFPGPSCRSGSDTRLTDGGIYELVVNASNGRVGAYYFVLQAAPSDAK